MFMWLTVVATKFMSLLLLLLLPQPSIAFLLPTQWPPAIIATNSNQYWKGGRSFHRYSLQSMNTAMNGNTADAVIANPNTDTATYHLLSLNYETPDGNNDATLLNDLWHWKDKVMGDGRDFFAPKSHVLSMLQHSILLNVDDKDSLVRFEQVAILSNCARLEILVVVVSADNEKENPSLTSARVVDWVRCKVSDCLLDCRWRDDDPPPQNSSIGSSLSQHWTHVQGAQDICRRICFIAAGMAIKPNAPGQVEFRPYTSRDSHILWQLKRTEEAVACTSDSVKTSSLRKILQSALRAGKACRDATKVPELVLLEIETLQNSATRAADVEFATAAAIKRAIEPAVQECMTTLNTLQHSQTIQHFRSTVMSWSDNDEESRWLRQQLHIPTLKVGSSQDGAELENQMATIHQRLLNGRREQRGR